MRLSLIDPTRRSLAVFSKLHHFLVVPYKLFGRTPSNEFHLFPSY